MHDECCGAGRASIHESIFPRHSDQRVRRAPGNRSGRKQPASRIVDLGLQPNRIAFQQTCLRLHDHDPGRLIVDLARTFRTGEDRNQYQAPAQRRPQAAP
ncbi:MAG: hypothetical protein ACRENP_28455 [Longimicrobiales bacterium]